MSSTVRHRRIGVGPRDTETTVVLVRGEIEVASWPLGGVSGPDLSVIDDLARLQLAARRVGCSIRLRGAGDALWELLDFAGLAQVVRCERRL